MEAKLSEVKDRTQLEAALLERVAEAKARYESAKTTYCEMLARSKDLGMHNPDGALAMKNALRIQRAATLRYTVALKALTDFTLGKSCR